MTNYKFDVFVFSVYFFVSVTQAISVISNKQRRCGLFFTRIKLVARVLAWGCDPTHQMEKTAVSQDLLIIWCLWHLKTELIFCITKYRSIKLPQIISCLCKTSKHEHEKTNYYFHLFIMTSIHDWSFSADSWLM